MEGAIFMLVPVENNDGGPLSPCHPARARILLKQEKATIVTVYPFVIRLTFQVENPAFPPSRITLDEGKTVGLGVVEETGVANVAVCKVEMKTRGEEISDNLKARKALRGARRNCRNRPKDHGGRVKIHCRHGREYPPSIRADVDAKVNAVRRLMKMYPVTEIVLEPVKLGVPVTIRYGYETKALRKAFGLSKSHANDAVAAGCNPDKPLVDESTAYRVKLHARHGGRKLFDANPGVAKYRSDASCQPGVDHFRMGVDEHDQDGNKEKRGCRRHVRNRYYNLLRNTGQFNGDLLPGKRGLNEVFTANRAILLTKDGPVLVQNQRIGQWKYNGTWPARNKVIERYDLVRTSKGDIGIVTSIMSNCTVKVDFTKKREGRKASFSIYKPGTLTILQKSSSQNMGYPVIGLDQ